MVSVGSIINLVLVSVLWGATNPLMKKGATGLEKVKSTSAIGKFCNEIVFLITNIKYIAPFIVNQLGSVLYFILLQQTDLSLAVPVTNSLTFVVTALTGRLLGEQKVHAKTYIGMTMVLLGTAMCCLDKLNFVTPTTLS